MRRPLKVVRILIFIFISIDTKDDFNTKKHIIPNEP